MKSHIKGRAIFVNTDASGFKPLILAPIGDALHDALVWACRRESPWSTLRAWMGDRELVIGQSGHDRQDAGIGKGWDTKSVPRSVRTEGAATKRFARVLPGFNPGCFASLGRRRLKMDFIGGSLLESFKYMNTDCE